MTADENGEVAVILAGETFRFRATIGAVAVFQETVLATGTPVDGLRRLFDLVEARDQAVVLAGLRACCTSDNRDRLDDLPASVLIERGPEILFAAMFADDDVPRRPCRQFRPQHPRPFRPARRTGRPAEKEMSHGA
jgi:hypothetical protein